MLSGMLPIKGCVRPGCERSRCLRTQDHNDVSYKSILGHVVQHHELLPRRHYAVHDISTT